MDSLTALASEEARRLIEKEFSYHNPYSVVIEDEGIPYTQRERYYALVEEELLMKGEKITRNGQFFKIDRYQNKKWPLLPPGYWVAFQIYKNMYFTYCKYYAEE